MAPRCTHPPASSAAAAAATHCAALPRLQTRTLLGIRGVGAGYLAKIRAWQQSILYNDPVVYDWQHIDTKALVIGGEAQDVDLGRVQHDLGRHGRRGGGGFRGVRGVGLIGVIARVDIGVDVGFDLGLGLVHHD